MLCFIRTAVDEKHLDGISATEQAIDQVTDFICEQGYNTERTTLAVLNLNGGPLECIFSPSAWSPRDQRALPQWTTPEKLSAWLSANIPTPEICDKEIAQAFDNIYNENKSWSAARQKGKKLPQIGATVHTEALKIYALERFRESYEGPMDITDPNNHYCKMGLEEEYLTSHPAIYVDTDDAYIGTDPVTACKPTHVVIMEVRTLEGEED